jgi:integrase
MPQREKIAKNVYRDRSGVAIIYRDRAGKQREIHRPHGTPIHALRDAVFDALEGDAASGVGRPARGTLAQAVDELATIEDGISGWVERRSHLRAWVRATVQHASLGEMQMSAITDRVARTVMNGWLAAGVAPKTVRERRWVLRHLFQVLCGAKMPTPVDDVPPPARVRRVPTYIDPQHVLTVYGKLLEMEQRGVLRDAKTRARFMVRASTGRRPSEIMRTQPADVQRERREWRVRDAKGGWSEGLYLNEEMLAAWDLFFEADAWGPFNTGAFMNTIRSAGWNPNGDPYTRAYELRHNVGIALSDAGIDLSDISPMLGHADLHTTRRIYVPIRNARMQRASEALAGRFNGWQVPSVPATLPVVHAEKRGSLRKTAASKKTRRTWRKSERHS